MPVGGLGAARADPALRRALRVRPLLGLDLVGFRLPGRQALRRAYWDTANRSDYEALMGHPHFLGIDVDTNARGADGKVSADRVEAILHAWREPHTEAANHA